MMYSLARITLSIICVVYKSYYFFSCAFREERFETFSNYQSKDFITLAVNANEPEVVWGRCIRLFENEDDVGVVD